MAATTENRIARTYSFTFDSEADKARYHAHAKSRGLTLAGLIKLLLADDVKAHPAPPR